MNINLENTETLDSWSPDAELRLLGDPEKLNPHHVPGSLPSVLVTIKQGSIESTRRSNRGGSVNILNPIGTQLKPRRDDISHSFNFDSH